MTESYRLFDAIDGRTLDGAGGPWRITVFSVVQNAATTWLQLALKRRGILTEMLTIGVDPGTAATSVLQRIAAHIEPSERTGHDGAIAKCA